MNGQWFWLVITAFCVLWYSTVTLYVAYKGIKDIREMLRRLAQKRGGPQKPPPSGDF
ncbi:MAG: hypothetical protein WCC06_05135 [Candidatus Aminicenantales bacterium]